MFPAIAGSDIATGDIVRHLNTIIEGVDGTPMQSFRDILSDVDLASVVTFQRNSLGNAMGDSMQPYYVDRVRQGIGEPVAGADLNFLENLSGAAGTGVNN